VIWHFALSILGHWATITVGAVLVVLGVAKPLKVVPDFFYSMAIIAGVALSGGGYLYDSGYRSALRGVEVARLKEDLAQADENIRLLQQTAEHANERDRLAAEQKEEDTRAINKYTRELAVSGNDLQLTTAELDRLRGLVRHYQVSTSRAASTVRPAGRQSAGCRGMIAELTGALNEANSRLVRDFAFYDDVRKNYCRTN
jgi:hypothetical protein